jgi:hypothetical protein
MGICGLATRKIENKIRLSAVVTTVREDTETDEKKWGSETNNAPGRAGVLNAN